ncbi:BREX system P-loop protein BrxC [Polyangium sorediatum]|uniref:BREX system P-loop protein BrxC n=1 Tax=Polyangium sorediatum TaxID=889274 RepID=A0ABT6P2V4_9BACT|nr:BREX system P-loop protein BrxC [Polyangium sorediatum]MDI1434929.1 BREX system P-loop protein BrxC [Polyangium sorediatum]
MKIRDLFAYNVTRDIPPVVYFHEQSPKKLEAEVSEYIITGGYPEGDPRARRVKAGIHEQFVHLLRNVVHELGKKNGPELPASWISGFYGSGKSSFAKLLGLALDGVVLPDGTPLSTALLARDDSPKRAELSQAWQELSKRIQPIAVVFDIGGVARDNEHIHAAVQRQVQVRLEYCPKSNLVAEHELKLERDGEWDRFLVLAEKTLGKPWSVAMKDEQAEDHFSHVLHVMNPDRYREPTAWIDSRAGARTGAGTSVREVVEAIEAMLAIRQPEKTLFFVVDEVSQYVHQDESRMLKLQSFVSELGQRLKGRVWLFATGQQKLEDQGESNNIGKLKDRFPPSLRVHLGTTNIRDVVHKRLLKKKSEMEGGLRALFHKHRGDLKLYGYGCEDITEDDFVEVYPMLPGHVDLLMQITSNLRTRSTRVQGDDHAIRGLLQLLGELFREQKLADGEVGSLVTLDAIFEVQHSALDADVQTTLARIMNHPEVRDDVFAQRAAKAVALLELIQEQVPTMPALVAQCLYARLGEGSQVQAVTDALEKLRQQSLLSYSEKQGYKIQSSAGQEWQREREEFGVTQEQISKIVQDALKVLVGSMQERPRWHGRTFPWSLWFSDGRQAIDVKLQDPREESTVAVDFRFLGKKEDRASAGWVQKSDQEQLRNRILWVVGESGAIEDAARQLGRSERMVERNRNRRESLTREKQRLLIEEEARCEELAKRVSKAVDEAFLEGAAFFRGQQLRPRDLGSSFAATLSALATRVLPDLYPHFTEIAISPSELNQLLEKELAGPSTKFMEGGLGILSLDAGKYVATCGGLYPTRILQEIQQSGGIAGQNLIGMFVSPPYGYAPDLVKACCAGLLRGKKIRVRPDHGDDITSYQDPGVRDLFAKDRDFRRADFFPAKEGEVTQRDRIAIRKFFETYLKVDLEPEDEPIADAAFLHFPGQRERLRELEAKFNELPGRPPLPTALQKLGRALEDCCRSRQVQKTVLEVKRNLDALRDGIEQLGVCSSELTSHALALLGSAVHTRDHQLAQLRQAEALGGLEEDANAITNQLAAERPWRDVHAIEPAIGRVRERYVVSRRALLNKENAEAEAARSRVKTQPGFALLDADQGHRVLRPIAEALVDTTAEAVAPTLAEVRDRFASRIGPAEEEAMDRLDDERSKRDEKPVVKVDAQIRGREISSREQLRAIFRELEERIGPQLDQGIRIRIV